MDLATILVAVIAAGFVFRGVNMPFFESLYNEFRHQTQRSPDNRVNEYKAECLNRVLEPLKDMMRRGGIRGTAGADRDRRRMDELR